MNVNLVRMFRPAYHCHFIELPKVILSVWSDKAVESNGCQVAHSHLRREMV